MHVIPASLLVLALLASVFAHPAEAAPDPLGQLKFEDCDLRDVLGVPRVQAQCARFTVAENRDEPNARHIDLRVARVEARLPGTHADPVVLLAGGPGQAAVDAYVSMRGAFRLLNRDRDVLLIDQRGTGGSNRLACGLPDPQDEMPVDAAEWRRLAQDCLRQIDKRADARFYTTSDYIDDLESVRAALGNPQFNLIGGSYGTRVALEYLRRHPQAIRSVVIDGVIPPELPLLQDHARNLDEALDKIFAQCAANAACAERYGDPGRTLDRLRRQLNQQPLEARFNDPLDNTPQSARLSRDALAGLVRLFSYQPESASLLPLLLSEASEGRAGPLLAQLHSLARQLVDQLAHGMELSVVCTEDAAFLQPRPEDATTVLGTALTTGLLAQCEVWPRGRMPEDFKQPVTSDKPVLILSGEYDPVTPPRYGDAVARTLSNSRHLIAPGQGHIAMQRGCMPRLVDEFVDSLVPASLDAACLNDLGPLPAFLNYQGFGP